MQQKYKCYCDEYFYIKFYTPSYHFVLIDVCVLRSKLSEVYIADYK